VEVSAVEYKELKATLKTVVQTESGKKLLAYLKSQYLLSSCKKGTVEDTYYELGRRELVQELISLLDNPMDLDNVIINNH
jgi:hypothetical protein